MTYTFEEKNALVNRFNIECAFQSVTTAYLEYLQQNEELLKSSKHKLKTKINGYL